MSAANQRRILMLVSCMRAGGAERVAATLVEGWSSRGVDTYLLATYSRPVENEIQVPEAAHFIRLADFPRCRGSGIVTYARRLRRLRALVREIKPDLIVAFLTNVNVFALIACAGLSVPVVVSERVDPVSERESGWLLRLLRRLTYPFADAVVVQTDRSARGMSMQIGNLPRLAVIPNPVPTGLHAVAGVGPFGGRGRRVVAMGRLTQQKRFDLLIAAFAGLAARHSDWNLWIWGEGPLREVLERQVSKLGLAERVFLPGRTDRPWHELALAEVFVLSSDFEGFPNAMLEAMALGKACVATDCMSGPRELSDNGTSAVLVRPDDVGALLIGLECLMDDDGLRHRLGESARRAVIYRYSIDAVMEQWASLFRALGR